jgi:hypothetical protein
MAISTLELGKRLMVALLPSGCSGEDMKKAVLPVRHDDDDGANSARLLVLRLVAEGAEKS